MKMYWGLPGSGKTLHLAMDCCQFIIKSLMQVYDSFDDIDNFNRLGFNFDKNFEHLSCANFDVNTYGCKVPNLHSYKVNPFRLGLYSPGYRTDIFPPGSMFFITEFQNYCDSVMYQYLRPAVKAFYQTKRHYGVDFVVDCQRPMDIAKPIRDLVDEFVELVDLQHIKVDGVVVRHKWRLRIIRNPRILEEYLQTNNIKLCEEKIEYSDRCYFNNYDSFFCKDLHLVGRKNQNFKMIHFGDEDDSDLLIPPAGYFEKKSSRAL